MMKFENKASDINEVLI